MSAEPTKPAPPVTKRVWPSNRMGNKYAPELLLTQGDTLA
jgi:hypothetical protein